ncbi:MAG TPA: helix-turn-helix transcriptional regulator [Kineosporiaceae bacterium]|nr:helix-turn-helix transcriptional regulator [Kineosporiaceae bacterium]
MGPAASALIARNIAAERVRHRWTQADLAEHLGVGRTTVASWETGHRVIAVDALVPLCRALGVPLVELLRGLDPEDLRVLGL